MNTCIGLAKKFSNILWKNLNKLFGQSNTWALMKPAIVCRISKRRRWGCPTETRKCTLYLSGRKLEGEGVLTV